MTRRREWDGVYQTLARVYPELVGKDDAYVDDGCEESPSCLSCPLPQCRYDDPVWYQAYRAERRREQVQELKQTDMTIGAIGRALGVGARTVHRDIRKWEAEHANGNGAAAGGDTDGGVREGG